MPHEDKEKLLAELRALYAELHREIARQALLEAGLERARDGVNRGHEERASALAPYAMAYEPHAEAYMEEALGKDEGEERLTAGANMG
jgi:predicted transcriptional regulator